MFHELRIYNGEDFCDKLPRLNEYEGLFVNNNINKLDIKRAYRYLDKNLKKDVLNATDEYADDMSL
jgi:hypothetical protein